MSTGVAFDDILAAAQAGAGWAFEVLYRDLAPSVIGFAISFAVIGRYWFAHHQFFAQLRAVDPGLIGINLVYLAFVAFLPFPTALLGNYFENPLSVAVYAPAVAVVSALEVALFRHARRRALLRREMPADVYRWGTAMSSSPVAFFLLSVPVAFLSTVAAVACWFLAIPFQALAARWKPAGADEFLP